MTTPGKLFPLLLLLGAGLLTEPTEAQGRRERPERPDREGRPGPVEVHESPSTAGIAWFGTWEEAKAEAARTGRPILFMSAAPQCQGVPGVW